MDNVILSIVNLNHPGRYVHWGVIQLSVANLIVIILMIVVFVLALVLPFHHGKAKRGHGQGVANEKPEVPVADADAVRQATGTGFPAAVPSVAPLPDAPSAPVAVLTVAPASVATVSPGTPSIPASPSTNGAGDKATWTGRFRVRAVEALPPDKLLPDRQPAYVASWIYIFGALTLAAFGVVLLSGAVLAIEGPTWWHVSHAGLFVNSMHLWGTELFFFFMVIHLWGKFFMAAWRGRRRATWITGVLAFLISIATAFTGYLSQQNFDSEWISTQAKDGINATGAGAFWNVLNFGQMLLWHVLLLPLIVVAFIGVHVLLVRRRGVVPPFAKADADAVPSEYAVPSDYAMPAEVKS